MPECCNDNKNAPPQPSRRPAHELWVELSTRITSQSLHFRSGQEEAAVKSIVGLFETTRTLMRANPDGDAFNSLAEVLLETLRPYTARWHGLQDVNNRFLGPSQRRQFRFELGQLQPELGKFVVLLKAMAETGTCDALPKLPKVASPSLGADVPMGIELHFAPDGAGSPALAAASSGPAPLTVRQAFELMNESELQHIAARKGLVLPAGGGMLNGAGLALSGGGIRSATFCLGVVQALAEKKVLTQFDYLSTVSGGGYLGCFLSNQFVAQDVNETVTQPLDPQAAADASSTAFASTFTATAEDSKPLRHLRNSSKYLLPTTTLGRLELIGLLLSGVLATTLLTVAIPVFCAYIVHWFARAGWLDRDVVSVSVFGYAMAPFWFGAALGAAIAVVCWLLRPVTWVWRFIRDPLDRLAACVSVLAAFCLVVAATPSVLSLIEGWTLTSTSIAGLTALFSGTAVVKAIGQVWKYRKALSRLFILSGAVLFIIVYLETSRYLGLEPGKYSVQAQWVVGALLTAWLLWAACVNLNLTGLHRYYRDRLASCYLEDPPVPRGIPNPPPLEKLAAKLPYHLVNTTANLTASENPELRGRGGDFFLLSKQVCGSVITGYQKTADVSAMNPDLDLATAMAISGAAASTNMGWQTMREYRVLMAIFNVRLGYWMRWRPDPWGWLASNAFVQLTREMLGLLDEKASSINVSDGGHIENLGVYELLRRRLKFIVCVDGGMDGAMECPDLNRLQRLVAIDFGYQLHFDAADLKINNNFSSSYGVLVKIDYTPHVTRTADKQLGWMLYIKLALLGTESNYILDYRRANPFFPHQTTVNQFFDEAQFEAYRKLGETAASSFLSLPRDPASPPGFKAWFTALARYLLRDTDPVYGDGDV